MGGTRAVCIAWLTVAGLGGGCSGKKSEPPPGSAAPPAPSAPAASAQDLGAPAAVPVDAGAGDAGAGDAGAPPDPIASLFRRRYTPDESLPERMRRRIRYHLRDKTRAPIALHHITYIPQGGSGADVFAIYEYSVHEDCVIGYANRKEAREKCTSEPVTISDPDRRKFGRAMEGMYVDQQVRLNSECVALGVVRAHFEPPGPDVPADAGGAVTLWSAKLDGLCEVDRYNHLFVADLDGDERPELYLDLTTSEETLHEEPAIRDEPAVTSVGHRFERHLYLFGGDGSSDMALSLELGEWEYSEVTAEELVELRDVNRDRRLDVVQREFCYSAGSPRSLDWSCDGKPRRKTEYVYDPQRDAWFSTQDAAGSGKEAARGSAEEPASGSGKEPASGSGKEPAAGSAKQPAGGGAKQPAGGGAKQPEAGGAAPR